MTMKHTPAPWTYVPTGNRPEIEATQGGHREQLVCRVESLSFVADARLIAAAPDLLSELVKMRGRFYAALVSTGTDAEFASAAVADADLAIKRATEG